MGRRCTYSVKTGSSERLGRGVSTGYNLCLGQPRFAHPRAMIRSIAEVKASGSSAPKQIVETDSAGFLRDRCITLSLLLQLT